MPEVKWVKHRGFAEDDDTDNEVREQFGQTPVLTLDDLEAWLKDNTDAVTKTGLHVCIDDLLAQVQAMRGDK